MELSLIVPVAHLELTKLLPGRFCIGSVAAAYPVYESYFRRASAAGYKVILDNGVFEDEVLDDTVYIELARSIQPTVLVVPDTIGSDAQTNWEKALAFAGRNNLDPKWELMFVPQCECNDAAGLANVFDEWLHSPRFKWVGICRDAIYNAFGKYTNTEDQELNRFHFSVWAQHYEYMERALAAGKKFHFLGIGERLDLLQYYWFVNSMDTASFFYQSTLGVAASRGKLLQVAKRPRDYFTRNFGPESDWLPLLKHNCRHALHYASEAQKLRNRIEGKRL